jgi:hypothetical protein
MIASMLFIASRRPVEKSSGQTVVAPASVQSQPVKVPTETVAVAESGKIVELVTTPKPLPTSPDFPMPKTKRSAKPPKEIQDPDARAALSLVGADPEAEQYWVAAINDPNLPANERKDLIEDLNEDGLSDPKHPGPQDLPLILNRLQLIEALGPYAMDQVNADAFQEAQKDLLAMLDGKPVQ